MRDEEYRPEQVPSYGEAGQPAAAARAARQLRTTTIGTAVAAVAVGCAVIALAVYPDFYGAKAGHSWAVAALVSAVVLLAACAAQLLGWRRAVAAWRGTGPTDLATLSRASWSVQVIAYAAAAVAVWTGIVAIVAAGWLANASVLLLFALAAMLVGLVLAGVQYVRASGPPGTVPAHMHKVVERSNPPTAR